MEIIEIYSPYIYSIQYDGQEDNEFDRLFSDWMDVERISDFMERNKEYLKASVWQKSQSQNQQRGRF